MPRSLITLAIMRLRRFTVLLLVLAALGVTACSAILQEAESELATNAPSAADINAAASQAAEDATIESTDAGGDNIASSSERVAPSGSSSFETPRINRRTEVPDDLRVNWLLPWDGIRPIYNPEFTSANDAPLEDDELIIGVAWDGEAKAYPISVLRSREMVNDELAGIPTLVTW